MGSNPAKKPSILVVDDDDTILDLVRMALAEEYDVSVACDGSEGLSLFRKTDYDLVVTDLVMPRLDGFILISELRKLTKKPIVAMSGGLTQCSNQVLHELGADAFISKHELFHKLPEVLRELLTKK